MENKKNDIDDLINNYIQNYYAKGKNEDIAKQAWVVDDLVKDDPETAWLIILNLIEKSDSDELLAFIAAGPLEDIIRNNYEQFINRIEEHARKYAKFRKCLTGVWLGSDLKEEQKKIIQKYTFSVKDPL